MSTFSLPHLLNGGNGRKKAVNQKYDSLNRYGSSSGGVGGGAALTTSASRASIAAVTPSFSSMGTGGRNLIAGPPSKYEQLLARRKTINRDGSIARNQFRGIQKQMLESQTEMLLHTMTTDELYATILYEILHNVGTEYDPDTGANVLFAYVQEAFKISHERHTQMFDDVEQREPPELRLNIEVIEAKELQPKDPNGLADPFVTMYLASDSTHRYNSSVKPETLHPLWEEHFSLPIRDSTHDETLVIEVWDFDAAETVGEKVGKIFQVKGVRGLRRLVKEIALTASTGRHDNELIGRCNISMRTIPASGLTMWFSLDKKGKNSKPQGLIKVHLTFSSEKNYRVAAQEHRQLLQILLDHELEKSKWQPFSWAGQFSAAGQAVLTQHAAQSGLLGTGTAFARWSVFTALHATTMPLSFTMFESLLDKLIRPLQTDSEICETDLTSFWTGVRKLLPSCFTIIRKMRKKSSTAASAANPVDKCQLKQLSDVLGLLSKVALLEPPPGTDLFPRNVYGWLERESDEPSWDLHGTLLQAIVSGARDWFETMSRQQNESLHTDEQKLQQTIDLVKLIRLDVNRAVDYYDPLFQSKMRVPFAHTVFMFYEARLAEHVQPVIASVCKNLKRISAVPDARFAEAEHVELNMGTTLFEVYLVVKRFVEMGPRLSPVATEYRITDYPLWFAAGVTHWLDISVYKALIRVERAIELDVLQPVDESVKYSSSAVDTLSIFYQIKIFWQQLAWPDVEGAYAFIAKIVDDICRCCVFYTDRMAVRLEGLGNVSTVYATNGFEVTREWCLAINNIDYIRQSLAPFVKELCVDDIILKLAEYRSVMEAERCADTLKNVIDNAIDTVKNKILELIEILARKMSPSMRRFLTEGAELLHQDSNSMDRLMMYMEDSLSTLNAELNELNFERVLDTIWYELSTILYDLVQSNLDRRRPPSFFANLRDTLALMVANFKKSSADMTSPCSDRETLESIDRLLTLHGFETSDLINQYYLDQYKAQQEMTTTDFGQLTVRCWFNGNTLEIYVMSASKLMPMDANGLCDPFVRIRFIPEDKFANVDKPKTSVQKETLHPLFDEQFSIPLTSELRANENAVVLFSLKDRDMFGMSNAYIAECYLAFKDICTSDEDGSREQIHMKLSRPHLNDTDCIRALANRKGDKQAKDFLKKLRQKEGS